MRVLWDNPESGPLNLAIDIPFGFPDTFIQLVTQGKTAASIEAPNTYLYLFSRTEYDLFEQGSDAYWRVLVSG